MTGLPQATFGKPSPGVHYLARPCAYGVTVRDSSVLLIQGTTGGWFLPGGGIEHGETHERALVREILEELGCMAKVELPFARATQFVHSRSERTHFELGATFHRAALQDFSSSTGEHPSEWVPIHQAHDRLHRAADAWAVDTYLRRYRR